MLPLIQLEARVVGEPSLRFAPSGIAVCTFRSVSSSRKKEESGAWVDDKTCWLDVTCFKTLAEHVAESVVKGDLVMCTGSISTDEWQDKETGDKRSATKMIANNVGVSLLFRTVPHGEKRVERTSETPVTDPWATAAANALDQESLPPF